MGHRYQDESRTASDRMDDGIRNLVSTNGGALAGQVVGHYEIVAEIHDPERPDTPPKRVRWSPPGSSPHLSLGLLQAATVRLEHQLAADD